MGSIISSMAFLCPSSSYNKNMPYLKFVEREVTWLSNVAWYKIPIRFYLRDKCLPTMIVCHGNNEDIGQTDPKLLSDEFNVNVCLFDYAGYGLHTCKTASEYECQNDVLAVYEHLIYEKKINQDSIIIYGRSLGSGIAVYLSHHLCQRKIKNKLILVSPLYSAAAVVTNMWIPGDIFKNYLLAPEITCPTLILHGDIDGVVNYNRGRDLSLLFPNLTEFVTLENCDHNNIFTEKYYDKIKDFTKFDLQK
jgi:uncharacterized protein